jgi:hypothetical protein
MVLTILTLSACNGGCAGIQSPSAVAETPEQHAYALYGQFVIAEETAAGIVEDPATPQVVKDQIAKADATAKPVADNLLDAARSVMKIRAELAQGKSSEEKLAIAITNLEKWIADARPKIEALVASITRKTEDQPE